MRENYIFYENLLLCYGSNLWNVPFLKMKNTDDYDDNKLKLTAWCQSSDTDKIEIYGYCI